MAEIKQEEIKIEELKKDIIKIYKKHDKITGVYTADTSRAYEFDLSILVANHFVEKNLRESFWSYRK